MWKGKNEIEIDFKRNRRLDGHSLGMIMDRKSMSECIMKITARNFIFKEYYILTVLPQESKLQIDLV